MECGEIIKQFLLSLLTVFRKMSRGKKYTLSQILILSSIPHNGMDMTSLSDRIGVDNSTATRLIGGLIKLGLITRMRGCRFFILFRAVPRQNFVKE